jgi:hypothetical protein
MILSGRLKVGSPDLTPMPLARENRPLETRSRLGQPEISLSSASALAVEKRSLYPGISTMKWRLLRLGFGLGSGIDW